MSIENLKTIDSFAEADAAGDPNSDLGSAPTTSSLTPTTPNNESAKSPKTATGGTQIENLKNFDPFAEADEEPGDQKAGYIHIRIQQRNGRKTLTTVQGLPKKFDRKKILKVIKKKFACNGTIVVDQDMGEVIQLQGDQRKDVQEFLTSKEYLELDPKTIKVIITALDLSLLHEYVKLT
ncbi:Eukaryotic translation initiation factor eIF-1 protein [Rutstroemia sp. NJR-2017a WRK4]|nr:translation initiation factor SUI1 protein [Rutstroemia sp. NJR-2017a BBW]PQE15184.1 Eukaryotic translation initiation factor eIF-1 protein [Rutstroemia sp. NJR-2017a WRK4]